MKPLGVYFSTVTSSTIIKPSIGVLYGLWVLNNASATTYAVMNSGTSVSPVGTTTKNNILFPKSGKSVSVEMTEIFRSDAGIRCPAGIFLFLSASAGTTAVVAYG